jgi:hypothetical protein
MKIKKNLDITTDDFWYDLTDGGYLKPEEILEDSQDVERVLDAIATLELFRDSCIEEIEDFVQ